jgi:hypothetical protein
MLSWMMIYSFSSSFGCIELGRLLSKLRKRDPGLLYHPFGVVGVRCGGFDRDLGLGEDPSYFRIISATERRFRDLAGIDTTLPTLGEIVWFLRSSGRGRRVPKGILLVGPPGTGKTFLVQAVAGGGGAGGDTIGGPHRSGTEESP